MAPAPRAKRRRPPVRPVSSSFGRLTTDPEDPRAARARLAVSRFRAMTPQLTGFARMLTRNENVRVLMNPGAPHTDGTTIYLRPPLALGEDVGHDRQMCGKRGPYGPYCEACERDEEIIMGLYHEIGHIVGESFAVVDDYDKQELLRLALVEAGDPEDGSTRAGKITKRIEIGMGMMKARGQEVNYLGMAGLISPYLPILVNAMEDWRVNAAMIESRPGTREAFGARYRKVLTQGIEELDGSRWYWSERDTSSQALIGVLMRLCDYEYEGSLDPGVVAAVRSPEMDAALKDARLVRGVRDVYRMSFGVLEALRTHGYCLAQDDPEADQPEPEPEPDKSDDDGDDQGDDTGADGPESEQRKPSEKGEPGEPGEQSDKGESEQDADGDADADGDDGDPGEDADADGEGTGEGDETDGGDTESDDDGAEGGHTDEPADEDSSGESDGDTTSDEEGDGAGDGTGEDSDAEGDTESDTSGAAAGPDGADDDTSTDDTDADADGADSDTDGADDDTSGAGSDGADDTSTDDDGADPDDDDLDTEDDGGESGSGGEGEPDYGDPEQSRADLERFLGHDNPGYFPSDEPTSPPEAVTDEDDDEESDPNTDADSIEVDRAIVQECMDRPAIGVGGIQVMQEGQDITGTYAGYGAWSRFRDPQAGSEGMTEATESLLGPSLMRMRIAFADNYKRKKERNLKGGRVNARVLGRRAAVGDPRLFQKGVLPGKKDYFVCLGLDVSGSTSGQRIQLMKSALLAQAELLDRAGVKFAVYAHTGIPSEIVPGASDLVMYEIKGADEIWTDKQRDRLRLIYSCASNLDGHTLEFYRKVLDQRRETDRIIMYYTDGAMPAENYHEELDVLTAEINVCHRKGYVLMAVGVENDDPLEYGMDTVRLDGIEDVPKVVAHLGKRLAPA